MITKTVSCYYIDLLIIQAGILFARNILDRLYLNFLGPIVYNSINSLLISTGESLVDTFTAGQLMEGRHMKLIEYVDIMLQPIRWTGLVDVANFQQGSLGIFNFSFGIITSVPYFELGPYESYVQSEDGHTVGHIHQFVGRK